MQRKGKKKSEFILDCLKYYETNDRGIRQRQQRYKHEDDSVRNIRIHSHILKINK